MFTGLKNPVNVSFSNRKRTKSEQNRCRTVIFSQTVLFLFFFKLCGSHPFYLLERGTEITGIGKPDFIGYFIDIEIGICE